MEIKATLYALDNRHFICGECLNTYRGRLDEEPMIERLRQSKACRDVRPTPIHTINREINFSTCIGNFFSSQIAQWYEPYRQYQNGILPFPGSMSEQPNKVIELFRLFGAHEAEKTEQQIKKNNLVNKKRVASSGR